MLFRRICQGQLKNDIEEAYLGRSQTSMTELLGENTPLYFTHFQLFSVL